MQDSAPQATGRFKTLTSETRDDRLGSIADRTMTATWLAPGKGCRFRALRIRATSGVESGQASSLGTWSVLIDVGLRQRTPARYPASVNLEGE